MQTLKSHSALQQLLVILDLIHNSKSGVDVIYMDFRKAFDSVSHVTVEALEDFVGNTVQGLFS